MKSNIIINQALSNKFNEQMWIVTIDGSGDAIDSEADLIEIMKGSIPEKKGIIKIERQSKHKWKVFTAK